MTPCLDPFTRIDHKLDKRPILGIGLVSLGNLEHWPDPAVRVLHAEIDPSVRAPLTDNIKDRGQVRAMWHRARDLDARNLLIREFAIPSGITSGSEEDINIRTEEGWILGCPS